MVGKAKDWFPNDKATHAWLDSYKPSSRYTYQTNWKYFLEYAGMTGDQIIEDRKADKDYAWEKKTLEFKNWMTKQPSKRNPSETLGEYTATGAVGAVRSFFAYHRLELQFRRTESARLTEAKRKTEDYRFSREDLKKMAEFSDLEEEYVVVVGKSFGLRAGDFLKLTRGDLKPYIERPVPISIGEYSTQKESVPAYPFIDSDAQPVIKRMLEKMSREGRKDPNERMLTHKDSIQLTRILKRVAKKAGIEHGNKQIRFHCLRKFLCDRLSDVMSESKWKQVVGKTISEGAYVSADSLREDYQRAMEETAFTKPVSEEEVELRVAKRLLEGQLRAAGLNPRKILRSKKITTTAEAVAALQEALSKKRGPIGGGLPFEMQARKALADILVGAIQDTKKRIAEKEES
jgi:integrase